MNVSNDYYEAEVREGYFVPSEMKRCWAATIGVLEVIEEICSRHGIEYFAEYGTLLGAVRHGGFIPWDDDFDISMKRDDYMRFLEVAGEELPEGHLLLSVHNTPEYDVFLSRVVNSKFICLDESFLDKYHNFPYAVGVDIFPLDYFDDSDEKKNSLIREATFLAQSIADEIDPEITDIRNVKDNERRRIKKLFDMCNASLPDGKPIRQQIYILMDRLSASYDSSAPYLSNMHFWIVNGNQVYKKEYFENTIRLPFEFSDICAPAGYDHKLQNCYGPGYMTPQKSGGAHDYPLYGKQKEIMISTTGRNWFKQYEFEREDLNRPVVNSPQRSVRKVVFLPFKAKYWPYMEKEWEREQNEENTKVYVIPIPYYSKDKYGLDQDIHYEADMFPSYVPITPFDAYDIDGRMPDKIVIQNPFDEFDSAVSVHPRFYTRNLLLSTKELVYIPFFSIDDKDLDDEKTRYVSDFYIKTPGVTRCDKVYLQSEEVRSLYIDKLCEFAGKDTKHVWEERLEAREYIVSEAVPGIREEYPDGWWKYLLDDNDEGKKVILFHTSASDIVIFGDKYMDKLKRVLNIFADQSERLTPIWQAHPCTRELLENKYPKLWESYKEILDGFISDDYGIYDDGEDYSRSVAIADAYYGDRDRIMNDFVKTGRPIMIMNTEI